VAAAETLPRRILEPCETFSEAARQRGLERGFEVLQDQLEPLWSAVRPDSARRMRRLADWSRSLAARAAFSGAGRSARQVARRIRAWTGLNERDLAKLAQVERLFAELHLAAKGGTVDWSALAAGSGFSDQPHMIRQLRQHTGFTPEKLRLGIRNDEALWAYRLLGEYFDRPPGP
ncbi:MAG: helix-turn-helix transcriptional regulator, partial [Proteobacteria bacterium]|nr:helix-turn-helix transcriptional regulator [Pseudomonadota bacterium]